MTDAEVVRLVLQGERHKFTLLVQRYQNMIYGLAYHYTHNFEDARDAAQNAFIRAYCQIGTLREPDKFGAWLKQLTVNECRMRGREKAAQREDALEAHEAELPSPDSLSDSVERRVAVQQAMAALPEANRLALTLFYFYSYSLEELAAFLEVPVGTIMSRLRNARRQLKKEWVRMTQEVIAENQLPGDWAETLPIPYDEYDPANLPKELATPISPFREQLALSALPSGSIVIASEFEGGGQTGGVFSPIRLKIQLPNGDVREVRVQMQSKVRGVEVEAKLLPILSRLGLPVPTLLAGPAADPAFPDYGLTSVTDILPGENVLSRCWNAAEAEKSHWIEALIEAIERMHSLTQALEAEPVAKELERSTLADELQGVVTRGGPWMNEPAFVNAVRRLEPLAAAIQTPLVFSNGIYAPNAFHTADGQTITGYNNFTFACFEDPHIGFAKYWIYDWYPLNRAGIVDKWIARHNLTRRDFAVRMGIRCLTILQREVPVRGKESADYRNAIQTYLQDALNDLN